MKTMPIYIIMSLMSVLPQAVNAQENCLRAPQKGICQTEHINLYVGPQSVEPGEDIFIAIETMTKFMESSSADMVTIINADTGQQYQAVVNQGLAYVEIKAPTRSGRLMFTAQSGAVKSAPAEVLVHAGRAEIFNLMIEKNKGQVFVSSSIIADKFGNILDDGMSVDVELISETQIYSALTTRTYNGRIGLHIDCNVFSSFSTRLRARIAGVSSEMDIPPYICGGV